MANENVIQATFDGFYKTYTEPSWFIDHGMELSISGIDLPDEFECHFSNSRSVAAKRQIGENGVVTIPDEYFLSNAAQIFCWIYLHPTVDSGVTEYEIVIPLLTRPNVDPAEPTQEQQDIVDQAIAALNVAMAETSADAESASASATAAQAAVDSVLNMTVSADTLPSGSDASVTKSVVDDAVHLAFGIPQGAQGVQGEQGVQGPTGATPNFTIGTVQTLLPTQDATATITGTAEAPVLNLGIPKGYSGDATNLAADYSSNKTYAVGEYCIYNGSLYRCITAITTAEAWTAAHWTAAVLGDDVGDLKSAVGDVRVEATVENVITVSQATETISGTHIPTITYGENNSLSVVLANTGTNIWGYTFETVIGKTYNVSLGVVSGGVYAFSIYIIKNDTFSSTKYITNVSDVVTGQYSFEFTAITATSTIWFSVNRRNQTCSMSNITVTDKSAKGWKYGSLQTTFVSEDFPPTSKAVGDAITPHITGETNIFVGQSAGKNTVESTDETSSETYDKGRYNAGVGYNAMISNTEGHHCTAVGFCALRNNTTGAFNTAIGEDVLYDSTTQSGNTGVGSHVMQKNTGGYNVAVGAENSRYPTNMEYSVSIGYHANFSNYNGTNNVFIGAAAGPSADVDNCIAIGTQATVSDDNQIVIGNASNETVIIAGKVLTFNLDGSVTWTAVS